MVPSQEFISSLGIEIDENDVNNRLNGCINDVNNMKKYLLQQGYTEENINVLTDKTFIKPTRNNIIQYILDLVTSNAKTMFLHYSGHGFWIPDKDNDEVDGRDEVLVPLDYKHGLISDDQLRGLLSFSKPNTHLTILLDCCHSGTGMDLPFYLSSRVKIKKFVNTRSLKSKKETKLSWSLKQDEHYFRKDHSHQRR